jgi:hypothetical protein
MEKNDLKPKNKPKKTKYIFCRHNLFVWLFLIIKNWLCKPSILHNLGSHIITAYPGGGKTLLMNKIINDVDETKYFFLSNMKEFSKDNVYSFNLEDIFKDNEQVASFPIIDDKGRKLYGVIFDEINLTFNKRLNRKSSYNDIFIGLIEFLVSHRHQDVPRVYFIGQKLELQDTQLQSLFKIQHDIIKCRKFPKYKPYNLSGNLIYYPIRLKVIHKIKSDTDEFLPYKKQKIKIKEQDYKTYNTKYLGTIYKNKDKINVN